MLRVIIGKDQEYETEIVLQTKPFESSMNINFLGGRVYVNMKDFGYEASYSWKLSEDHRGYKFLNDFQSEKVGVKEKNRVSIIKTSNSPVARNKLTKCPECYRITFENGKCSRCGHGNKEGRFMLL